MKKSKNLLRRAAAITAASLMAATIIPSAAFGYGEMNVGDSTFKTDTDSSQAYTTWRSNVWNASESADSGKVTLTPGADENDLNFAWYSETKGNPAVKVYEYGKKSSAKIIKGTATEITAENWQGSTYAASNKVSVEDYFKENTEYRYVYTDNYVEDGVTEWSDEYSYTTSSSDSFSVILTGDPQIGASGDSDDYSSTDSSAARDAYNWDITLQQAIETDPDAAFLLSAGDQINQSGATSDDDKKTRESEYAGYLFSSVLRSLPVASTIGNHDMAGIDYTYHFNNPNTEDNLGATDAGCDYYFSYGDVLFISLNSNNRNQEEHRELMEKAIESNSNATWKVVIFHSDIYGSGQPHADTDAATNRVIFAPLMDEFDIDVCLTGHDHTYSRSYQILDGNVIDYGDEAANEVSDPEGTLYITTGSGSGSKYYNLLNYTPYYIAERTNDCLPAFSTIDFSSGSLTIKTYDYNGEKYADDFTINKTANNESASETIEKAEAIDTKDYTDESVKTLTEAVGTLKTLVEKITTASDPAITTFSTTFGTEEDPVKGYGSVKNDEDKDSTYVDAGLANRFKKGYSTLLDKTIYLQLADEAVPVVEAADLKAAQESVNKAITSLVKKETTTPDDTTPDDTNPDDTTPDDTNPDDTDTDGGNDVGTGDTKNAPIAVAIIAGAAVVTLFTRKKESNCEER